MPPLNNIAVSIGIAILSVILYRKAERITAKTTLAAPKYYLREIAATALVAIGLGFLFHIYALPILGITAVGYIILIIIRAIRMGKGEGN